MGFAGVQMGASYGTYYCSHVSNNPWLKRFVIIAHLQRCSAACRERCPSLVIRIRSKHWVGSDLPKPKPRWVANRLARRDCEIREQVRVRKRYIDKPAARLDREGGLA